MFVSKSALELFHIGKDTVDDLRRQVAALDAENFQLRQELTSLRLNNDWFRIKVNQMEAERTGLLEKAYGIKIPTPEIVRAPVFKNPEIDSSLFEDVGDKLARDLGFPSYTG